MDKYWMHHAHFCPDWDYAFIDDKMSEFEACICCDKNCKEGACSHGR